MKKQAPQMGRDICNTCDLQRACVLRIYKGLLQIIQKTKTKERNSKTGKTLNRYFTKEEIYVPITV